MATKAELKVEKFYECEVKRRRVRESGRGYEPFWKTKKVDEALVDEDTEFRCKDCHGAVKLHKRQVAVGSYVEHKLKNDSEYCSSGWHFQAAIDGRTSRLSEAPVA